MELAGEGESWWKREPRIRVSGKVRTMKSSAGVKRGEGRAGGLRVGGVSLVVPLAGGLGVGRSMVCRCVER